MSLVAIGALVSACGGGDADLAPVRLLHSPAVEKLAPPQLRTLSMDCEKYPPKQSFRGRYDAAYCEAAIAAWGDSPLQMVVIPAAPAENGQPVNR
jgi:hypothetical protein